MVKKGLIQGYISEKFSSPAPAERCFPRDFLWDAAPEDIPRNQKTAPPDIIIKMSIDIIKMSIDILNMSIDIMKMSIDIIKMSIDIIKMSIDIIKKD